MRNLVRSSVVAFALVAATLTTLSPAHANARVSVSNEFGNTEADITYGTTLSLSGSGFLANPGGFGGIYVLFGIRDGDRYLYIPDAETNNNAGYQLFISHPGNTQTGSSAHSTMSADGTWNAQLNIPGATFQTTNRSGQVVDVDCRVQTCGVITIGAHGVSEPRNETFTPVSFTNIYDEAPETANDGEETENTEPTGLQIDHSTAVAGRVLSFTADSFEPGEQVLAILDDGLAASGPFTAGHDGRIAGLIDLPADLSAGTHELRLTGASSDREVTTTFAVRAADNGSDNRSDDAAEEENDQSWLPYLFAGIAGFLFLLAVVFLIIKLLLVRRADRGGETDD